jgi:hypothetical protein
MLQTQLEAAVEVLRLQEAMVQVRLWAVQEAPVECTAFLVLQHIMQVAVVAVVDIVVVMVPAAQAAPVAAEPAVVLATGRQLQLILAVAAVVQEEQILLEMADLVL